MDPRTIIALAHFINLLTCNKYLISMKHKHFREESIWCGGCVQSVTTYTMIRQSQKD